MPWVRLDENFAQHPKVVKAGPLGMAMHVAALCYCNRHLTDGFVPKQIAKGLLDLDGLGMRMWEGELVGAGDHAEWGLVVDDLISAGLWIPVEGGWRIHDYLEYQPAKSQIIEISEKRRASGKKGGQSKTKAKTKQTAKQNGSKRSSKTEAKSKPDPDPDPPISPSLRSGERPARSNGRFQKPSIPEIRDYVESINASVNPATFFNHYESNGWRVGKSPMKDWRAAVRNWNSREQSR